MRKRSLATALAVALSVICGGAAFAAFDALVTPDAIFGGGNANGSFTTVQASGVELGLRGKLRFNAVNLPENTFNSNGDGTYSFAAGFPPIGFGFCPGCTTTPFWNFEWSVNTDWDGSSGLVLDDLTYRIGLDFDPSLCTSFLAWDHITVPGVVPFIPPVPTTFWDHSTGTNATANGAGVEAIDAVTYAALTAANNVAQNSWSYQFFNEFPFDGFDPSVDGTYDIYLSAFDGGGIEVASVTIQIIVGTGGAACTGACCTDGPGINSECLELDQNDCVGGGGLYIGDHVPCAGIADCVPLLVEYESITAQATPQGVLLRWTTTTEVDTMGFRILRESGTREKKMVVVNPLIPGQGHGLQGASYEFLDNSRQPLDEVRYYLEDIDAYGRATRHGPIAIDPAPQQRRKR